MRALHISLAFVIGGILGIVLLPTSARAKDSGLAPLAQRTIGRPIGPTDQEVLDWSFPAPATRSIQLTNYSGDILLRQSERPEIRIKATKHNAGKAELDQVIVDVKQRGDSVIGKVDYLAEYSSAAVSFLVEAPPGLSIELMSSSGNIKAESFDGKLTLESGSGTIIATNIGGEVHATTGSGDIHAYYTRPLRQIGPRADLKDGEKLLSQVQVNDLGGNIVIRKGAKLAPRTFTTSSGTVTLHLGGQIGADVFVEALSRQFTTDFPEIEKSGDEWYFRGSIDGGGPTILLGASSGSIVMKRI